MIARSYRPLQADLRLAELELARIEQLVKEKLVRAEGAGSREKPPGPHAAEVDNLDVAIGKKTIRAPFAGRLGIRKVNLGQFIEPGDPIVRLESLGRLYADFKLPAAIAAAGVCRSGRQHHRGRLARRDFPRGNHRHRAGRGFGHAQPVPARPYRQRRRAAQAGHVRADRSRPARCGDEVLLIPQAAISFSPFGNSVFVLERNAEGTTVRNVYVGTGETRGDLVEVVSGLKAGQEVVTAGQQKLRDGATVNVDNSVPVSASATPEPAES